MKNLAQDNTESSKDDLIDQVLGEISQRLTQGEPIDLEDYVVRFPQYGERLRRALPGMKALIELGHDGRSEASSLPESLGELGDFRIIGEIGRGGMGVVYEAEQISLPRRVALKMLPFAAVMDKRQLQRFKNEARAAATLNHPGIVNVYSVGSQRGVHYYAMQLVEGQSVAQLISELRLLAGECNTGASGPTAISSQLPQQTQARGSTSMNGGIGSNPKTITPEADATPPLKQARISTLASTHSPSFFRALAELGFQAAEALDHAHTHGVLHRDVKPANLLIDELGKLLITDFGLARIESDAGMTMTGDILGTLRYMSPEQALAKRVVVDCRSDIYSLGVTIYELLTLEAAFQGRDRHELLKQIAFEEPRPPRKVNKVVPAELEIIVLKAMAKNPTERYSTARELADDLERYLQDKPIHAKRPTLVQTLTKWTHRHKSLVAAGFLALAVSVVVLAVSNIRIAWAHDRVLQQKEATEKQLRMASSLRLAAQSRSIREERPIESLLLSIEAIETTRQRGEGVLPAAEENLRDTLSVVGGMPLLSNMSPLKLAFTAGDQWMVTTNTSEGEVRIWDLTRPWNSQVVLRRPIDNAVVSADGRWLAEPSWVADGDGHFKGKLQLWDLAARDPQTKVSGHTQQGIIQAVKFSPDGSWLAVGGQDGIVRLWDLSEEDPSTSAVAFDGQRTGIWRMAISPNSRWLAVGSHEGTARLWDLTADDPNATCIVLRMSVTERSVRSVAFSPDSRWLATGCGGGAVAVRLWDLEVADPAANPVVLPGHHGEIDALQFSPDGEWLVSGAGDNTAQRWNLKALDPLKSRLVLRHESSVGLISISPDSRRLFTAGRPARLWDLTTEDPSPASMLLRGHDSKITNAGFTADSETLITRSIDGAVRIWDLSQPMPGLVSDGVPSGRTYDLAAAPQVLWGHRTGIGWMESIAEKKKLVAASTDGEIRLWDLSRRDPLTSEVALLKGAMFGMANVKVSQNGQWLALSNREGEVHLCDLDAKVPASDVAFLGNQQGATQRVAFSPNNRWLAAAAADATIMLWGLDGKGFPDKPLVLPGKKEKLTTDVAFSANSRWLAVGNSDREVQVWDREAADMAAEPLVLHVQHGRIGRLQFSTDSKWLATANSDHTVGLWNMHSEDPTAEPYVLRGHEEPIRRLTFSADGRWLATFGGTEMAVDVPSVRLWDLSDRQLHNKPFHLAEQGLSFDGPPFSPDGRWLTTASRDGTVRLWNLNAANLSAAPAVLWGHTALVRTVAFSPDSRWLVTGGGYRAGGGRDSTLRLWDLSVQNPAASSVVMRGHRSPCTRILFSADSRRLMSCSYDGTVRLWNTELDELLELARRTAGRELTPDERRQYFSDAVTVRR